MDNKQWIYRSRFINKHNLLLILDRKIKHAENILKDSNLPLDKWHFFTGEIEAIHELKHDNHKELIRRIKEINTEIKELDPNDELYQMELSNLKGFKKGIEIILDSYHDIFSQETRIRILGICPSDNLVKILELMYSNFGFKVSKDDVSGLSCYFSTDFDQIKSIYESHKEETTLIIFSTLFPNEVTKGVKNSSNSNPQDILEIRDELVNEVGKSISSTDYYKKLNEIDLSRAMFVQVESVFTIDALVNKTLQAFKI